MNPTPTDPREEQPFVRCCDDIITDRETKLAQLAAEIAELKADKEKVAKCFAAAVKRSSELATTLDVRNEQFDQLRSILELDSDDRSPLSVITAVRTLRAELEAVNTRYSELAAKRANTDRLYQLALNNQEDLGKRLEAARKERDEVRESHRREIGRLIEQRDGYMDVARRESLAAVDVLAAKDAAEKRVRTDLNAEWEILKSHLDTSHWTAGDHGTLFAFFVHGWEGRLGEAAYQQNLTPAPTQEPPAGGLPIGTKIRFLKTLYSPPNEEHPYLVYAHRAETGEITGYNNFEGYFVRTDRWQTPFGASLGTEFEPFPPAGGVTISNPL